LGLKQQSTCFESTKPQVQIPDPRKKEKGKEGGREGRECVMARCCWLTPVILTTWKAEIKRIEV
jgi:hypothetical protein